MNAALRYMPGGYQARVGSIQWLAGPGTGWTILANPEKIPPMPLPATSIDKLSDHSGSYVICVTCRQCEHEREIDPRTLANILGWNVTLKQACTRLCCSK